MTDGGGPSRAAGRQSGRRREDRQRAGVVRVAAVGDFHCGEEDVGRYRDAFAKVNDEADVLLLAGDLTRRGTPAEFPDRYALASPIRFVGPDLPPTYLLTGANDHCLYRL